MSKQREALQVALEAMNRVNFDYQWYEAKDAIREALAVPPEPWTPVAWMCADDDMMRKGYSRFSRNCQGEWNIPVYTAPPARKPLTDAEIDAIIANNVTITDRNLYGSVYMAIREVEAAHGIGGGE
jgi:hypothetical protein